MHLNVVGIGSCLIKWWMWWLVSLFLSLLHWFFFTVCTLGDFIKLHDWDPVFPALWPNIPFSHIILMLRNKLSYSCQVSSNNCVLHWFDSAWVRPHDLPHGKTSPHSYRFGCPIRYVTGSVGWWWFYSVACTMTQSISPTGVLLCEIKLPLHHKIIPRSIPNNKKYCTIITHTKLHSQSEALQRLRGGKFSWKQNLSMAGYRVSFIVMTIWW